MNEFQTPPRLGRPKKIIKIPASPFLKKLGYGTGVAVYKLDRSPIASQKCSPWAIKKLLKCKSNHSIIGKRLKEEADILRKLEHPNIVGFRALMKGVDGKLCLAMEQCNVSLGDLIEERSDKQLAAFPVKNIMKMAMDISEALDYLHNEALLLHCDLKSYNILIKDDFVICKLCDFGVSVPLQANGVAVDKAGKEAEYTGTQSWAAPEVLQEPPEITAKADVFSYGLVVWEMLALCPPSIYSDENTPESINGIEDSLKRFSWRPDLPNQDLGVDYNYVLELFHCCTEELPCQRPSANDLTVIVKEMIVHSKLYELL